MGSFVAVLLVVAVCIAAYLIIKRSLNKGAPKADPIGGGGSQRNPVPPAKS